MCRPMILGWYMATQSSPIQAGIQCPGFFGAASDSHSVSDLVSATSEVLGGAGAIGDTTGMDVEHSSTITSSSHTAESSATTASITVTSATVTSATEASTIAASTMVVASTGLRVFTEVPTFTLSPECTPARSVDLITAEMSEAFPPAGGRALAVGDSMAVVGGTR